MGPEITVSVCIANYNGMDVIDDCIRSVQSQVGDISIEILVHDDASSDSSVAHIQEHYPHVNLIISETNLGFCIANNRMAALAKGKYLLLLNNDAALYPDGLSALFAEAKALDKPAVLTLPQYDATTGALVDRGCLLDPFFNPVPNLDPTRSDVAMVIGACLWIPKITWNELGGFPEWFGSIAEDMYLCCSARSMGYHVRALKLSGYLHWQGASFGGGKVVSKRLRTTIRRRALSERNKTFVMMVTCPGYWLALLLPIHLNLLMLEGLVLVCLKGNISYGREIYLSSLIAIWRYRHAIYKLRQSVQERSSIDLLTYATGFKAIPYKLQMLMRHGLPDLQK